MFPPSALYLFSLWSIIMFFSTYHLLFLHLVLSALFIYHLFPSLSIIPPVICRLATWPSSQLCTHTPNLSSCFSLVSPLPWLFHFLLSSTSFFLPDSLLAHRALCCFPSFSLFLSLSAFLLLHFTLEFLLWDLWRLSSSLGKMSRQSWREGSMPSQTIGWSIYLLTGFGRLSARVRMCRNGLC